MKGKENCYVKNTNLSMEHILYPEKEKNFPRPNRYTISHKCVLLTKQSKNSQPTPDMTDKNLIFGDPGLKTSSNNPRKTTVNSIHRPREKKN